MVITYQRHAEITADLKAWADRYPGLCRLDSLGQSPEGREIWSVTLTNFATGEDGVKPAYHINGQHHAGEVTAAAVAMYTIRYLLESYGSDARVTELLDTRAVYLLPRIAVDGAEWYFDHPQMLRSSPILYPEPEEPAGLRPADIDGDGKILRMRLADPHGDWKISAKDPRLMVRRRPEDREGPFYRLYTEGLMKERGPDGVVAEAWNGRGIGPDPGSAYSPERGFDFNRNYPTNWKPQFRQRGSGRYPFDRLEIRAMAQFWLDHRNIGAAMSYHTYSGMNLRPSALAGDDKLNPTDLALYKALGETAKRITGYPTVSVYDSFTLDHHPDRLDVGSWLEWCYDELGVQGFEMELWDWPYICGVPKRPFKELKNLTDEQREEEALLQLQWNDRELDGVGYTHWRAFEHPQFGPVELGGWDPKWVIQNPPEKLLEQECHKNCLFTVEHALALPLLRVGQVQVRPVGGGCVQIAVEVVNRGYLPTQVTEVAVQMKQVQPLNVEIDPGSARLVAGRRVQELGQLPGRGSGSHSIWGNSASPVTSAWAEWVVQGSADQKVRVKVAHERAGTLEFEVSLAG